MRSFLLLGCCAAALIPSMAHAQSSIQSAQPAETAKTVEDEVQDAEARDPNIIVVTAELGRERALKEVPISISAFDENALIDRRVTDFAELTGLAPGLNGTAVSSFQPLVAVRGIFSNDFAIGSDPKVGVFTDGVYTARSAGALGALYDVERIEVIKGPQGTLFGRNTLAGAINIITNDPTDMVEGYGRLTYGSFDRFEVEGMANLPVSDGVAIRASGLYRTVDGYIDNLAGGDDYGDNELFSGRLVGSADLGENFTARASVQYQTERGDAAPYQSIRQQPAGGFSGFYQTNSDLFANDSQSDREIFNSSLKIEGFIGDMGVESLTSYRSYNVDYFEDTDGLDERRVHFGVFEVNEQFGQELKFTTDPADWINVVFGASYYREDARQTNLLNYDEESICRGISSGNALIGVPLSCGQLLPILAGDPAFAGFVGTPNVREIGFADAKYQSYGFFADAKIALGPDTNLTLGGRYTIDDKQVDVNNEPTGNPLSAFTGPIAVFPTNGTIRLEDTFEQFTPRVVLDHKFADGLLVYASVSQGYTSGGFNIIAPIGGAYDPETLWSYEIGSKGFLFDRRLSYDIAAYYYEFSDLQVQIIQTLPFTTNAAQAEGLGFEGAFSASLTDAFSINWNIALLDTEYKEFFNPGTGEDLSGNRLARAPKTTSNLEAVYSGRVGTGDLRLSAGWTYTSFQFFRENNFPSQSQDGYHVVDARATYDFDSGVGISVWAQNLLGEEYRTQTQLVSALNVETFRPGAKGAVGVDVSFRF